MRVSRRGAALATGAALALSGLASPAFGVTYNYTEVPQGDMSAVLATSVETSGEGANGPIELILDGNPGTYWHTKWNGGEDPLPHTFVVDLGKKVEDLGRIVLTPRQSSNGSGRFGDFQVLVTSDDNCSDPQAYGNTEAPIQFAKVAEESIPALPTAGKLADVNVDFTPTAARCVAVTVTTAWGGDDTSRAPASLAEFKAFTATESGEAGTDPTPDVPKPLEIVIPEGAPEITDGQLTVHTHPGFPQVVDYRLGDKQLPGKFGDALSAINIDGKSTPVTVATPTVSADKSSVTYPVTFPSIAGASFNVVISVKDQVLEYKITDIVDPNRKINRIEIPGLDLVSLDSTADAAAMVGGAKISTNRGTNPDSFYTIAKTNNTTTNVWMAVAAGNGLAAGFETNAIDDQTAKQGTSGNDRYTVQVREQDGNRIGTVSPYEWVHRGGAVLNYAGGEGIGPDPDPFIKVKITADANGDNAVDWQDAAIATRDVLRPFVGMDETKNIVITRIPFNIVSQATHPFLRTLDDTKRISLATDNLGQQVLLKGYQAEGHDSAQGDYGNNYNERAGGLTDLKTLVKAGKDWNATFGVHVNATESYSEAKCFSDGANGFVDAADKANGVAAPCELRMPPQLAWGWMNQSYKMNDQKDLATGNLLKRLEQLRKDFPADSNLNWLYWDVYYNSGWQAESFAWNQQNRLGFRLGSEWAYSLPTLSTWSHWANDEAYGGTGNKGLSSTLIRFVENSYRDTFNPDPMLGNTNVREFEGWTANVDYTNFIQAVWQKNLPAKFLQQSDIVSWKKPANGQAGRIVFKNGTEVTSAQASVGGYDVAADRVVTYDGATVLKGATYLLPWKNGGQDRLYYYNPSGESTTWKLTKSWASQPSLKLYKLTDTGRTEVANLTVTDGSITIPATDGGNGTAYVLYPATDVPAPATPDWGEGSNIKDPGFFSGTLDAYDVTGNASVVTTDRQNFQAEFGKGAGSISQEITLPEGDYSAWAWIEIQPGKTREVSVSAKAKDGVVTPAQHQKAVDGVATTTISDSGAINATASDEKFRTHFQRVPVRFHTDGKAMTFAITVGEGEATVAVDDLRVVAFKETDPNPTDATIAFTNFEDTDTGYWPFVTGSTQGGDARTQLALRNEPYSQAGWWGTLNGENTQKGQKLIDNVLDGDWSLLAHQENRGLILRTTSASVPLEPNHTYKVSFDYQAAHTGDYQVVIGHDEATSGNWREVTDSQTPIAQSRGTGWKDASGNPGAGTAKFELQFRASEQPTFIGILKVGDLYQGDLTIDNFRVEELFIPSTDMKVTQSASSSEGMRTYDVTTRVDTYGGDLTEVAHKLVAPEGWTVTPVKAGATEATKDAASVATWKVEAPKTAKPGDLVFTGTWKIGEEAGEGTQTATLDPSKSELTNPIGGSDLTIADFSSEQTSGEPAPNGFAAAAIDGDANTYWHTQWSPTALRYPHHITLEPAAVKDNDQTCTFTGLEYTTRQNAANGRIKGYEVYVSMDGKDWGEPVATGNFTDDTAPQVVEFPAVEGKFVKLVGLDAINGQAFGGAGEIRLGGTCGTPDQPDPDQPDPDQPDPDQPDPDQPTCQAVDRPSIPARGTGKLGEFTGDRFADLWAVDGEGSLRRYAGHADGTFTGGEIVDCNAKHFTSIVSIPDMNGDGRADALVGHPDGRMFYYYSQGDGFLKQGPEVGHGWNDMDNIVYVGKLGSSQTEYVVARHVPTGQLYRYVLTNTGMYSGTKIGHGWSSMSRILGPGDMTGDRYGDIVAISADGTMFLYEGNRDGTITSVGQIGHGWTEFTQAVIPGDVNGDGRSDLVGIRNDGKLFTYFNRGKSYWMTPIEGGHGWHNISLIG